MFDHVPAREIVSVGVWDSVRIGVRASVRITVRVVLGSDEGQGNVLV